MRRTVSLVFLSLVLLVLAGSLGCRGDAGPGVTRVPAPREPGVDRAEWEVLRQQPVLMTKEAIELRRVRDEHRRLIASRPTEAPPTPTLTAEERETVAVARVMAHPDGIPVRPGPDATWFRPDRGLTFYRSTGGDWTPRRVRQGHTHRSLFYFENYPEGVVNFHDGSMQSELARELAFEAAGVMPVIGEVTPAMIRSLSENVGWELRDSEGPVVNVWTRFTLLESGEAHVFAVGGVMRFGVSSVGSGDDLMDRLVLGHWIGPVLVERLE